jgi:hypothetical protein
MKIKTSELSGVQLDLMVAKCEGVDKQDYYETHNEPYMPSVDWAQGGPIIEREKIQLWVGQQWNASMESNSINPSEFESGQTPLIAAMRCYVASKLGDEVEVHHASA